MAVKMVWGKCDGNAVTFTQAEGGAWTAQVPARGDGTYIIEIWAEDEAGNSTYFATVRVTFDPETLCYTVQIIELGDGVNVEDVKQLLRGDGMSTTVNLVEMSAEVRCDTLMGELTRCEVCA